MAFRNNFALNMDVHVTVIEIDYDQNGLGIEDIEERLPDDLKENISDDALMGHWSGTQTQWICVGIFLGILGILFPFEIYYTHKLWKSRFTPFIHARHPQINVYVNLTAAIFLIIERPMHAIHRLSVLNTLWFQWLRLLFYFTTMQFLLGFVILRFWLLLFEVKWTKAMTNKQWKKHIDTTRPSKTESFWVRSHKTWGNYKFAWKYVITSSILLSAIPGFLTFSKGYFIGSMSHGIILGIGVFLLYILWKTTPVYHDGFKILEECGFVLTWIGGAILCDLLFTSLKIIMGERFWLWFLSYSVPFLLLTGVIFLKSCWVLAQMKRSRVLSRAGSIYQSQSVIADDNDVASAVINASSMLSVSKSDYEAMSLYDLLKDKMGCHEFIKHLLKEFSCENILSVIEMTQYKVFWLKFQDYHVRKQKQQKKEKHKEQNVNVDVNVNENADAIANVNANANADADADAKVKINAMGIGKIGSAQNIVQVPSDEKSDDDDIEYITDFDDDEYEMKGSPVFGDKFARISSGPSANSGQSVP